jgi:two-component system chemotaxis response regulator CheB
MDENGHGAPHHDIVAVGASAGGIEALRLLLHELPADLPAAIFIVLHVHRDTPSLLPAILQRETQLPVSSAVDGEPIETPHVYVAPPDRHLLIGEGKARVVFGPKENWHRPAVDPLLRSAAAVYGARVVGVVLSGMLYDGAAGLWAVKSFGGVTAVQNPAEADFPGMPREALRTMDVDHVLPVREIAQVIERLAWTPAHGPKRPEALPLRRKEMDESLELQAPGTISAFTCPSCGGALWELQDGDGLHYSCHVGHAFSAEALKEDQADTAEEALWAALRSLKERIALVRRMAEQIGDGELRERYEDEARALEGHAKTLLGLLSQGLAA